MFYYSGQDSLPFAGYERHCYYSTPRDATTRAAGLRAEVIQRAFTSASMADRDRRKFNNNHGFYRSLNPSEVAHRLFNIKNPVVTSVFPSRGVYYLFMKFAAHGTTAEFGSRPPPDFFNYAHLIIHEERERLNEMELKLMKLKGGVQTTAHFNRLHEALLAVQDWFGEMEAKVKAEVNAPPTEANPAYARATTQAINRPTDGGTADRTVTVTDQDGAAPEEDTPPSPGKTPAPDVAELGENTPPSPGTQVGSKDDRPNSRRASPTLTKGVCDGHGEAAHGESKSPITDGKPDEVKAKPLQAQGKALAMTRAQRASTSISGKIDGGRNSCHEGCDDGPTQVCPDSQGSHQSTPKPSKTQGPAPSRIDTAPATSNSGGTDEEGWQTERQRSSHLAKKKDRSQIKALQPQQAPSATADEEDIDPNLLHAHGRRELKSGEDDSTTTTATGKDRTPRTIQRATRSATAETTDTATHGRHTIEATAQGCNGQNCLRKFTDSEDMPKLEDVDRYPKEPIEIYCASAFDIYIDQDLMLDTRPLYDTNDGQRSTKTAPPQVKTMERLDCKAKIPHWLVKRGG